MDTTLQVITERVDDIPLLFAQIERMGLQALLDVHFPRHPNWQGLSPGSLTAIWLTHILSEADHRMKYVEAWAQNRITTLSALLGAPVRRLDFVDDRLARLLQGFSCDASWDAFEAALNGQLLRVYDLETKCVRLDATTASGYFSVSQEGLLQFGHSKDHRPDLPQVKVMLSTLDPLGLPLTIETFSGQRADDPLYIPAIEKVHQGIEARGLLFVGDCKMAAVKTRAFLVDAGDHYLCPLSKKQCPPATLEAYLDRLEPKSLEAEPLYRRQADGSFVQIAEAFEQQETMIVEAADQALCWTERRLVVRSVQAAQAAEKSLEARIEQALERLEALNEVGPGKRRLTSLADAQGAVSKLLKRYRVEALIVVRYHQHVEERPRRRYRDRPARVEIVTTVKVEACLDSEALAAAKKRLAWRVYATNASCEGLPLERAILAYRDQYTIEHEIARLKGHPLSLSPMYLQRDDHLKGLIRLLSLALRVLVLLEGVVRHRLAQQESGLVGLDPVHRKRATRRPTAERLLKAFAYITLTVIIEGPGRRVHVPELSTVQRRILSLLNLTPELYLKLVTYSAKPP